MEGDAAGEGGGTTPVVSASLGLSFAKLSGLKAVRPASSADADTVHTKFLHHTVDQLCGRSVDWYHEYPGSGTGTDVAEVASAYQALFTAVLNGDVPKEKLTAVLTQYGVAAELHAAVAAVFKAREEDVKQGLVARLASISDTELTDFDWSLRTVISSDTASNMSNPVLVLRLTLRGATGKRHSLIVELTPKDLDAVLAKFADIAAVTSKLSV